MAILVDTGALELLRREDSRVEKLVIRHYPPLNCTHIAAEFMYGQFLAGVSSATLLRAGEFLDSFEALRPSLATANIYARLRADLKSVGKVLPDPDFWIAAHAIEEQVPLISTDRHFEQLPEVTLYLVK